MRLILIKLFLFLVIISRPSIAMENLPNQPFLQNSILGFGTQHINDGNSFLIQDAIDKGYRLFDCAKLYSNIDSIASVINDNKRDNLVLIYKITPPKTMGDVEELLLDTKKVIGQLKYIDCLMLHSVDEFHENISSDVARAFISAIKEFIAGTSVRSFGISNVGPMYEKIIADFSDRGLKIDYIENHCNHVSAYYEPSYSLLAFCQIKGIAFIAYGALGGVIHQGPCQAISNVRQPVIQAHEQMLPFVVAVSKKYEVDPMMLMLAFLAKQFGVHHIPTTTKSERVVENFAFYQRAFTMLTEEDCRKIALDIGRASAEEIEAAPPIFRDACPYKSRIRLLEYLLATSHPIISTIQQVKFLYEQESWRLSLFVNKMMFMTEQAMKFKTDDAFRALLRRLNEALASTDRQDAFEPLIESILGLETNQALGSLVDQFLQYSMWKINLIESHHNFMAGTKFRLIDDVTPETCWPFRTVIVGDYDHQKIVRFTIGATTTMQELRKKLQSYVLPCILQTFEGTIDLSMMPADSAICAGNDQLFSSQVTYLTGDANFEFLNFLMNFDPFWPSNASLYGIEHP